MKILDSVELGRLILSFYNLITNYSRIIQNSELDDLAKGHRYTKGGLWIRPFCGSRGWPSNLAY